MRSKSANYGASEGLLPEAARAKMVRELQTMGIRSRAVLNVMNQVPREKFVDEALYNHAYKNMSLPIGFAQTISQPYIVARMTEVLLNHQPQLDKVLEIGTGCGYQTVVLSHLASQVYTIERVNGLLQKARERFRQQRRSNIRPKFDDGIDGWPTYGLYDGIIVTAAAKRIPESLAKQLAQGGVMVFPLAHRSRQVLIKATRERDGIAIEELEKVQFVPLLPGRG